MSHYALPIATLTLTPKAYLTLTLTLIPQREFEPRIFRSLDLSIRGSHAQTLTLTTTIYLTLTDQEASSFAPRSDALHTAIA